MVHDKTPFESLKAAMEALEGTSGVGLLIDVAANTVAARFASVIEAAAVISIPTWPLAAEVAGVVPLVVGMPPLEAMIGDRVALGGRTPARPLAC